MEHRAYAEPPFFWSLPCRLAVALSAMNVPRVFKHCRIIVTFPEIHCHSVIDTLFLWTFPAALKSGFSASRIIFQHMEILNYL